MKWMPWRLPLAAALLLATAGCATAYDRAYGTRPLPTAHYGGGNGYDVWTFYDSLDPYGRWFEYPGHGWVWTPDGASASWRPYTHGHWIDTDYGWTWASNEPWGWGPYHYGRWFHDPAHGWLWVPGNEWAPSWVAWRHGGDWIGWAPLPPEADWHVDQGLSFGGDLPAERWSFVERRHFLDPNVLARALPVARNGSVFGRTQDATRFEVRDGRPINRGIDRTEIERLTGRRVTRVEIDDADRPASGRGQVVGGRAAFYRPTVRPSQAEVARRLEQRRETARREAAQRDEAARKQARETALQRERDRAAQLERERVERTERVAREREQAARIERERAARLQREMAAARDRATRADRARAAVQRRSNGTQAARTGTEVEQTRHRRVQQMAAARARELEREKQERARAKERERKERQRERSRRGG